VLSEGNFRSIAVITGLTRRPAQSFSGSLHRTIHALADSALHDLVRERGELIKPVHGREDVAV
jgi:hypothetical protein